MDKLIQRTIKSKTLKVFLVAIVLVFSYQVSKPKAIAPLAFIGAVGVGMAAEALVTMGVKAVSKEILKKQAKNYSEDITRAGKFDWAGLNPYRNKDGSITLSPTANDRAKMAGLVAGSLVGAMHGTDTDGDGIADSCAPALPDFATDTIQITSNENYDTDGAKAALIRSHYTAYSYQNGTNAQIYFQSKISGNVIRYYSVAGSAVDMTFLVGTPGDTTSSFTGTVYNSAGTPVRSSVNLYLEADYLTGAAVAESVNAELNLCGDLVVPSTIDRVYPAPMDMSSTYQMPNHNELANKPFVIYNVFAPAEDEGEVTWEEIEGYLTTNGKTMDDVIEGNLDTYLDGGDVNDTDYTVDTINNYYTDINYPVKVEDFNPETGLEPIPEEPTTDIEPIDRTMLQVIKESYQFLSDGIDTSISSMKTVTDGATGLINYLDGAFRWLPAEWRAMFGAAFVLGVFAHFFRR